jgi:hypothetical protein
MPTVTMPVPPILNLPFVTFLLAILVNIIILAIYYFIVPRLQNMATKNI